tara:strand:+ start:453 stop:1823 length:1371 start_codon:yes stop_codon:yes gene_type:complete
MGDIKTISEVIEEVIPYYKKKGEPETEHTLIYESYAETLEPVYFFILDLMGDLGLKTEKLIDNFASSLGGAHFSETGMKAARMQEETSKMMQTIGVLTRSILQIVYDLKDFKIRLQSYDHLKSEKTKDAALLSLKQIWLDKVDILKGNSSISMMARQLGFATVFDAFFAAKDEKDADKLDLNDRVKRVVKSRIFDFNIWVKESERELRKRYEIERNYLKSQVNSLKLYSRWVKPYLRASQQLEMKDMGKDPGLVNAFNRVILELTLLGKSEIKVKESALEGKLPDEFSKESFLKSLKRKYHSCVLVDFNFRGVPQQGNFIGKAKITFKSYSLNDDELEKINRELEKSDVGDVLKLIEGTTTESLEQLQEDINMFLDEKEKEEEKPKDTSNPFSALVGSYDKKVEKKESVKDKDKPLVKDNWVEKTHIRPLAAKGAEDKAFLLFDVYKKAHGMVSYT